MIDAAEKAGRGLVRDFGEVENLQVSKKGPGNFVSTADLKAEKTLMTALQKARSKYSFLMEEGGRVKGEDPDHVWIIDPLDGTSNFLHGIPHWCVAIALEKKKEIVAGVIYDPLKDEMFWAEKGLGAYVNNRRLQVSGRKNFADAMIMMCTEKSPHFVANIESMVGKCGNMRRGGSACLELCYVAAGRVDGFWEYPQPWDVAAGTIIVQEARGKITDVSGGKDYIYGKSLVASNGAIHTDLLKCLAAPADKKKKTAS
jgi:myo-inositol-1(or 4)-monophosphatase